MMNDRQLLRIADRALIALGYAGLEWTQRPSGRVAVRTADGSLVGTFESSADTRLKLNARATPFLELGAHVARLGRRSLDPAGDGILSSRIAKVLSV